MTESGQASLTELSAVRITKLKEGYTWNDVVSADDNSEDALQQAKERPRDCAGARARTRTTAGRG